MLKLTNLEDLNLKKLEEEKSEQQLDQGFKNVVLELEALVGKSADEVKKHVTPNSLSLFSSIPSQPSANPKKTDSSSPFRDALLRQK